MSKLLGLDYKIQYQKNKENVVANALSRRKEKENCRAVSAVIPDWVKDISASYENSDWAKDLLQLAIQLISTPGYTLAAGLIRFKGRLVVGEDRQLKDTILQSLHSSPLEEHSGLRVTYNRVRQFFFWPGL